MGEGAAARDDEVRVGKPERFGRERKQRQHRAESPLAQPQGLQR